MKLKQDRPLFIEREVFGVRQAWELVALVLLLIVWAGLQ